MFRHKIAIVLVVLLSLSVCGCAVETNFWVAEPPGWKPAVIPPHTENERHGNIPLQASINEYEIGLSARSMRVPDRLMVYRIEVPEMTSDAQILAFAENLGAPSGMKRYKEKDNPDTRFFYKRGICRFEYTPASGSFHLDHTYMDGWTSEEARLNQVVDNGWPSDERCIQIAETFTRSHGLEIPNASWTVGSSESVVFTENGREIHADYDRRVTGMTQLRREQAQTGFSGPGIPRVTVVLWMGESIKEVSGNSNQLVPLGLYRTISWEDALTRLQMGYGYVYENPQAPDQKAEVTNVSLEDCSTLTGYRIPVYHFHGSDVEAYVSALR